MSQPHLALSRVPVPSYGLVLHTKIMGAVRSACADLSRAQTCPAHMGGMREVAALYACARVLFELYLFSKFIGGRIVTNVHTLCSETRESWLSPAQRLVRKQRCRITSRQMREKGALCFHRTPFPLLDVFWTP
jgi:hypothetical protein